jgi:DNA-binding CsgD family transcriptional regulator/tetratricopeptide (TPR) repeat protein
MTVAGTIVGGSWHDGIMRSAKASGSLIGREGDLGALVSALQESASGATRTMVIGGEAGIGKSRLIDEFCASVPGTTVVVKGQCVDLDRDAPPYAPMTGALRALSAAIGADALLDAAGPSRGALLLLLPELGAGAAETGGRVGETTGRGGAAVLYDGVAVALENVSREHTLVIVIEDLQWADQATLGLLRFLVRVVEHGRVLFVLSYRSDDLTRGHPLRSWLPELDRTPRVSRRDLSRLTKPQVRRLVGEILGTAPVAHDVDVVFERTDGVPFLVEELVDFDGYVNADCFPDTLREILLARYDTLSEPTQKILRLMAAGGSRVDHTLLLAVHDGDADDIDRAAREAVLGNVIVIDDTSYAFRHALVRDAIHEELLPGERVRYHSQYARALEAGLSTECIPATEISYHWMAAHDMKCAFGASITAMAQARTAFAYDTASRMGERALELWDQVPDAAAVAGRSRVALLTETAHDLRNAGESDRAISLVDEALADSPPDDVERIARLLRDKASYLANVGRTGSVALLRRALAVLQGEPPSVLRATVLGELAARLMLDARFDESVEIANEAFDESREVGSRARMSVSANIRGMSLVACGEVDRGLADLERAGELAVGDDSARLRYFVNMSDAMNALGRFDDAIRISLEGFEGARRRGVERTSGALLLSNSIEPLFARGDLKRADELLERALELDPPIGFSAHLQRLKLWSTLWGGDVGTAETLLRGWRAPLSLQLQIDAQSRLGLARVAGEIALAGGNPIAAWLEVRGVLAADHRRVAAYDLPLLAVAARALAGTTSSGRALATEDGETDPARIEARLRAVLARCAEWPTAAAWVAVFNAELGGAGHAGTDAGLWRAAVQESRSPLAQAHLLPYSSLRLAEVLASDGDRPAALVQAQEARKRATEIGAGLIVTRVAELERRAGLAKPGAASALTPGPVRDNRRLLTERERQVLDLVEQGQSNRQVAQQLFISAKTASVHVSSILRKLGATSRTEAVFLAHQGETADLTPASR